MTTDDRTHNQNLLDTKLARLRVLELQSAYYGFHATPPHLIIEIDDLKKEIDRLQNLLGVSNAPTTTPQSSTPSQNMPSEQRSLSVGQMTRLVELLIITPSIADRGTRESVLQLLPNHIQNSIVRNDNTRVDTLNIVRTSLNYSNGIKNLLEAIRWFEGDSIPMQNLDAFVASLF